MTERSHHVVHVLRKPFAPKALWKRISCFFDELAPVVDIFAGGDAPLLASRNAAKAGKAIPASGPVKH